MEDHKVKLVCLASGEEQFQWTVEGGRLDWTAVKEAFQAEVVHVTNEGIPSCFQAGELTGLTRTKFKQRELQVSVVKKGASSQIRSRNEISTDGDVENALKGHRIKIEAGLSSPSATNIHQLARLQRKPIPALRNLRWPGVQPAIGTLCPILGNFRTRCAKRTPSPQDAATATQLAEIGRAYWSREEDYKSAVQRVLRPYFARPYGHARLPNYESWETGYHSNERTDGGIKDFSGCAILATEHKRLPDATAEEQCVRYHDRLLNILLEEQPPHAVASSCYTPAFTLVLEGCLCRVGGVVRGSIDLHEPLEQVVMLPMWQQQRDTMHHFSRVLGQLYESCHELLQFYSDVNANPRTHARSKYLNHDIPVCLQDVRFCNLELVDPAHRPLLFTYSDGPGGTPCVAKIVQGRMAFDVHVLWASHHLAPKLLPGTGQQDLPEDWFMLCMELLSPEDGWQHPSTVPEAGIPSAKQAALEAINMAHKLILAPGCTTVHGDARSPNIRMRPHSAGGWEVKFLDLDWAGKDGIARYPLPLNTEEKSWPPTAGYMQLITREHDLWQVEHAFTNI